MSVCCASVRLHNRLISIELEGRGLVTNRYRSYSFASALRAAFGPLQPSRQWFVLRQQSTWKAEISNRFI